MSFNPLHLPGFIWTDGWAVVKGYADSECLLHYWRETDRHPSPVHWYDDESWSDFTTCEIEVIKEAYVRKFGAPPPVAPKVDDTLKRL